MMRIRIFPAGLASLLGLMLLLTGCAVVTPTTSSASLSSSNSKNGGPTVAGTEVAPAKSSSLWPQSEGQAQRRGQAGAPPPIRAVSAILIDARTGETLYQKNADEPRQVASTQKLVTALIVAEQDPLDEPVRVDRQDTIVEPTKVGIHSGEHYSRRQLLSAMLVHSANDCAAALARAHSGSLAEFSGEMNRLAQRCGTTCSHFVNPHGLPAQQHSTARDMARIAFRAYHNPDLREAMAMRSYCFRYASGRLCNLEPTNKLLIRSPFFNGMKTGYTEAAGKCLISSYSRRGRELILVQLGSRSRYIFDDAQHLIGWAAGS